MTKEIARFVKSLKLYTLYKDAEEPSDAASAEEQKPSAPEASKETSKKKKAFETILPAAGPSKEIPISKTRLVSSCSSIEQLLNLTCLKDYNT